MSYTTYFVKRWSVGDWRVVAKPFDSPNGRAVSQHTTKQGAYAALRKLQQV